MIGLQKHNIRTTPNVRLTETDNRKVVPKSWGGGDGTCWSEHKPPVLEESALRTGHTARPLEVSTLLCPPEFRQDSESEAFLPQQSKNYWSPWEVLVCQ